VNKFASAWPWCGAVIAAVLLMLLFGTRLFLASDGGGRSRWHDIGWLAVLGIPVYMLHQLEEHGIDFKGAHYAFRGALCATLGFSEVAACPIPYSFITAVNVGSVWGATVIAALAGRRRPLLALSAFGIPFVNALAHIADAIRHTTYNPGLVTAVVLLLPVSAWALQTGVRSGLITGRGAVAIVLAGVVMHVVLMGSLLAYIVGAINSTVLVLLQLLNTFVPAAAVALAGRADWGSPTRAGPSSTAP
jgi:hypothetical protein